MRNKKVLLTIMLGGVILALPVTGTAKKSSGSSTVKFKSCKDARAAGYSDMKRGEPGYSPNLDRDNDGIACESK